MMGMASELQEGLPGPQDAEALAGGQPRAGKV